MITVTKTFHFCAAHYLDNYDGKCGHIHGHNYTLQVTIGNPVLEDSMIVETGKLSKALQPLIDRLDHGFFIKRGGWFSSNVFPSSHGFWDNITMFDENPTTETVAVEIKKWIRAIYVENFGPLDFLEVKLRETPTIEVTA